ncbi:MAG: signal peptidase I [Patescibacteria group bacterium]|jgi:signal peptidase I
MKLFCNQEHNNDTFWHRKFGTPAGTVILFVLEFVQIVVIALAIIIPVRYFLVQPFYVEGASMEPSFYDHEYLIIDELGYRFSEPERGQVLVFRYPNDPSEFFIKRIIGLPGETIEVANGLVIIYNEEHPNGLVLDESAYLPEDTVTPGRKKTTLGSDEYFVMGDNRDASLDSRVFGAITSEVIIGRVWLRGLPASRAGFFESPLYNL